MLHMIPVARFRCRHPNCAHHDPEKHNYSMQTLYEHVAQHLSNDIKKNEHLNLYCSCRPSTYNFVALPYATSHLNKYKKDLHNHKIMCRSITNDDSEISQRILTYLKRFVGFYKYTMEEDRDGLPVRPVLGNDEMNAQTKMPMPDMSNMGFPPQAQQFNPMMYGFGTPGMPGMPGMANNMPGLFPTGPMGGMGGPNTQMQDGHSGHGARTPVRTPVFESPSPEQPTYRAPSGPPPGRNEPYGNQRNDRDRDKGGYNGRGYQGGANNHHDDRGVDNDRRDNRDRNSYSGRGDRGGRGRGDYRGGRGDTGGRGNYGNYGNRGNDNKDGGSGHGGGDRYQNRRESNDARPPPSRRPREGASPRSSDDDEPASKRPNGAGYQGGFKDNQRNQNTPRNDPPRGFQRTNERTLPPPPASYSTPKFGAPNVGGPSSSSKKKARDGTSPRSDSEDEAPAKVANNNRDSANSGYRPPQPIPRPSFGERPSAPGFDRNVPPPSRMPDRKPPAKSAPAKAKKGMGDISDRSDSD